jgi:hypothetical protein
VDPSQLFDASQNHGNKPVFGTGLQRFEAFCEWAFEQPEEVHAAHPPIVEWIYGKEELMENGEI